MTHAGQEFILALVCVLQLDVLLLQGLLETLAFRYIAGGGENALQFSSLIVERRGVVTARPFLCRP